uniref:Uncharacterized protein n=1 Tax=Gossypium raimondii TaxID=29730 RepID=A0A0D2VGS6_GOSRA|nr:hypothetical protein B456_013G213500 [Gossypium raimondii]
MSCWHAALRSGFFEQKLLRKTGKATTRKGRGSHKAMLDLEISVVTIRGGFDKGPSQPTAILWAYSFCI